VSERGVMALRAGWEEVLTVASSFSPEEWERPSDCAGWRVQDVVNHMANVFRQFVDPASMPPGIPGKTEASQDVAVDACRSWTWQRVLADYEDLSTKGVEAVAALATGPMADTVVAFDDLGSHPLHRLANALAFDHYCHLRNDILQPNGPISRVLPPAGDDRVGAVIEWLVPGIPQMSPPELGAALTAPVLLRLTGDGGGEWVLQRDDDGNVHLGDSSDGDAVATVTSPAEDFVLWATHRRPWRAYPVTVAGDTVLGTTTLDAIHVF